jgi:hypothetical protein
MEEHILKDETIYRRSVTARTYTKTRS